MFEFLFLEMYADIDFETNQNYACKFQIIPKTYVGIEIEIELEIKFIHE